MHFPSDLILPLWRAAQEVAPHECCGLVFQSRDEPATYEVVPMENIAEHPEREFEVDFLAFTILKMCRDDERLLAIYHSHPKGPKFLSSFDREVMANAVTDMILIDLHGKEIRWYAPSTSIHGPRLRCRAGAP